MPTGPGGGGSSTCCRVEVSYSRIDPPEELLARQRRNDGPELRAALAAGQCEAQHPEIAADGLQLAYDRLRVGAVRAQLLEAVEGRLRVVAEGHRLRLEDEGRDLPSVGQV